MKSMTSTDTPLGSAGKLGEKLEKEKTPFIVLSGANKNNAYVFINIRLD